MLSTGSDGDECRVLLSQSAFALRLDSISLEPSEFYLGLEPSFSKQQSIAIYKEHRKMISKWRSELLTSPNRSAVEVLMNRELVPFDDAVILTAVQLEEEHLKREFARLDAEFQRQLILEQRAVANEIAELVGRGDATNQVD